MKTKTNNLYAKVLSALPAKFRADDAAREEFAYNIDPAQLIRKTDPIHLVRCSSDRERAEIIADRALDRNRDTRKGRLVQDVVSELLLARYGKTHKVIFPTKSEDGVKRGPDVILESPTTRTIIEIKSGPNAENSSSRKGRLHATATLRLQSRKDGKEFRAILFNAFGSNFVGEKWLSGSVARYHLWQGAQAWDRLTGEKDFYVNRFLPACAKTPMPMSLRALLVERIIDVL